jgi:Cu/Ag efflux protein CusF
MPPQEKVIVGPVQKIDPAAKTVQVEWVPGLFNTTLEVTGDTQIAVGGTKASLTDIREGDRVKAAYEARDGKNVAKAIEVNPPTRRYGDWPPPAPWMGDWPSPTPW